MAELPSNIAMVSEVSICNQALGWLGSQQLTSLADQTKNGELCRNNYPFLRDAVLEARAWTFATERKASSTQDRAEWGDGYTHPIPENWLWVPKVYRNVDSFDPNKWVPSMGWRKEGRFIIARESIVYMVGVRRVINTGEFSPLFVQALAARLAADLAIPITENRNLQADHWEIYEAKLMEAASRDGQQGDNDVITQTRLTGVRGAGGMSWTQ